MRSLVISSTVAISKFRVLMAKLRSPTRSLKGTRAGLALPRSNTRKSTMPELDLVNLNRRSGTTKNEW